MKDGFKIEKIKSIEDKIVLDIIEKMAENIGSNFYSKSNRLFSKLKNEDVNPIYAKIDMEDISDKFDDIKILEKAIKERDNLFL